MIGAKNMFPAVHVALYSLSMLAFINIASYLSRITVYRSWGPYSGISNQKIRISAWLSLVSGVLCAILPQNHGYTYVMLFLGYVYIYALMLVGQALYKRGFNSIVVAVGTFSVFLIFCLGVVAYSSLTTTVGAK